jgi:hypothetical protein
MVSLHIPARLLLAAGFALAIMIALAIALSAQVKGDTSPQNCTVNQTKGSYALACSPNMSGMNPYVWNPLASEQALTMQNETRH